MTRRAAASISVILTVPARRQRGGDSLSRGASNITARRAVRYSAARSDLK